MHSANSAGTTRHTVCYKCIENEAQNPHNQCAFAPQCASSLALSGGVVMPDDGQVNSALMIEELYIVPRSLDQGTGDVITSLDFVIDSPVSQG